ncbi:TonB-linked SusC/RagA family outer membrane protein [Anseongella ginsenosidimutans]|uniref:TonB-linked SusC/RagA family outer membrane protein n=1 Tax=Anseongella ginsenosidimutans TaxID=496056 RepID=A0A4R3KPS6_9SPHI|nr:TonB-dependent receptor [Anseongella ginsenosidimutans]QEC52376.1 TonB-dependent receptor [Anseongella ginsenosidimutans]TCS85882.1 TonB-linked SusC/RagA family outer membrane protein [Anseongella ginsenosidimutans]
MYAKIIYPFLTGLLLFVSYGAKPAGYDRFPEGPAAVHLDIGVRGTVQDSAGNTLPGVSVTVKGQTTIGTTTDLNGKYFLEVPDGATLIFSMIGYEQQEIPVNGRELIDVTLHESTSQLDDVVVVAFGTQKKSEMVGAVTTINPSELKVPSSNLTTALAGRLAGVIAYQRSGEPGLDNADFFIRGVTTFGYKVDPLILIDGVEFTATDLARLQPDDIASFSIMKDATATALYGARGANGVILVTTKEGKEGPAKVSFRLENSISAPTRNVELADPITYMRLHNEAVSTRDPLAFRPYSQSKIDNTVAGTNPYMYPATDWRKALFKDYTMNQRANFNVSGGGQVARYYFAGTYNQDNGVLKVDGRNNFNNNIDLKSYLLRSNVNVNITKTTKVGVRLYGSFDDYSGPVDGGKGLYEKVMRSNPVMFPAYYPVMPGYEHVQHIMFGGTVEEGYINPYADMVKGYKDYSRSLMLAQFEVEQDLNFLTEGLSFRALGNTNRESYFDVSRFYDPFYYEASGYDKASDTYSLQILNENQGTDYLDYKEGEKKISSVFYLESAMNYNRTFGEKHGLSGMLVYTMRQKLNANAGDLQQSLPFRNLGLSGRFTYAYDSRYYAEFNFGYNGSERFQSDYRFGFFPAGGVAWQVSNEKFWEPLRNTVSLLKVRATYGLVGNDAIGGPEDRFFYLSNVNMDDAGRGATFGIDDGYTRPGVSIERYDNAAITWETAEKVNLGLEMNLFGKVGIQADFFSEYRRNILMTRATVPGYMGLSADVRANVGEAAGRGMDLSVDYSQTFGPDLWIIARGNFTYATSEFKVYEEPEYEREWWKSYVGHSLKQKFGYIAERLFVDDEEVLNSPTQGFGSMVMGGDIKYRDINGDGQITPLDQVPIGNPTVPEIVYGFGFSAGFRNFDMSCFFQGLSNESFWIDATKTRPFVNQNQLLKAYADSHWSERNGDVTALWPRLSASSVANNNQTSTWFMRDGSFIRLKTAELGYTFREEQMSRLGLESLRIYLSGTNLLSWSRFKLWDIEMAGEGLGYPVQRVFNLGVQVSL